MKDERYKEHFINLPCCGTYEIVPFTLILPLNLFISPRTLYNSEDFPEPTDPTTASSLPCFSLNVRLTKNKRANTTAYYIYSLIKIYKRKINILLAEHYIILVVSPCNVHISKRDSFTFLNNKIMKAKQILFRFYDFG